MHHRHKRYLRHGGALTYQTRSTATAAAIKVATIEVSRKKTVLWQRRMGYNRIKG